MTPNFRAGVWASIVLWTLAACGCPPVQDEPAPGRPPGEAPRSEAPRSEAPPSEAPPSEAPNPPDFEVTLDDQTPPPGCQPPPIVQHAYSACVDGVWVMQTDCWYRCEGVPQKKVCHTIRSTIPCSEESPPPEPEVFLQAEFVTAHPPCVSTETLGKFRHYRCVSETWELWESTLIMCMLRDGSSRPYLLGEMVSTQLGRCGPGGRPRPPPFFPVIE